MEIRNDAIFSCARLNLLPLISNSFPKSNFLRNAPDLLWASSGDAAHAGSYFERKDEYSESPKQPLTRFRKASECWSGAALLLSILFAANSHVCIGITSARVRNALQVFWSEVTLFKKLSNRDSCCGQGESVNILLN